MRRTAQILTMRQSLRPRLGLSYLFIAHDLAIVRNVAHHVAVMFGGQVVELGHAAQVYSSPDHPYPRNLLDAVPVPDQAQQGARLGPTPAEPQFHGHEGHVAPCVSG